MRFLYKPLFTGLLAMLFYGGEHFELGKLFNNKNQNNFIYLEGNSFVINMLNAARGKKSTQE